MLFRHAHADLWSILGTLIRPYGLTINHTGLHLRIPHLESLHKARAAVHLTPHILARPAMHAQSRGQDRRSAQQQQWQGARGGREGERLRG